MGNWTRRRDDSIMWVADKVLWVLVALIVLIVAGTLVAATVAVLSGD